MTASGEKTEATVTTDQSVALLAEFEQAARDKIEKAISIEDNGFNCVVHVMQEAISDQHVARAVFSLNGKTLTAEARIHARAADGRIKLIVKLREEMASVIAREVLMPALLNLRL